MVIHHGYVLKIVFYLDYLNKENRALAICPRPADIARTSLSADSIALPASKAYFSDQRLVCVASGPICAGVLTLMSVDCFSL